MNDFAAGILSQLRSPDRRPITEWAADGNIVLPSSTRCKEFREDTAYWISEPLNSIPHNEATSICKPTQGSGTVIEEVFLGWTVANSPRPAHFMAQTDPDAEDIFRKKFLRTLRASPATAAILAGAGRNDITKNRMTLPTMDFAAHGQDLNSMQSDSVEVLLLDEAWRYDPGVILEILERTSTVEATRKIVTVSQAGEEYEDKHGKATLDEWGKWWHRGTQEEYRVRCPGCDQYFYPLTEHYTCDKDVARDPQTKVWNWEKVRETAHMIAPCCGHRIENHPEARRSLSASGKYFQTNFNAAPRHRSFRYSAWIVYWQDWGGLLEMFYRAQESLHGGDIAPLKIWTQKKEARWWTLKDADVPVVNTKKSSGYTIEEFEPKDGEPVKKWEHEEKRFAVFDMQRDRFPGVIRAFGAGRSRLLWCGELQHFEEIEAKRIEYGIPKPFTALDVGNWKAEALKQCWIHGWTALRGRDVSNFTKVRGRVKTLKPYQAVTERLTGDPIYFAKSREGATIKVWEWSNTYFKDIFSRLRGMAEHEIPDDIQQLYIESMESEAKDTKSGLWRLIGKRQNHYWDDEAMLTFFAFLYKLVGGPQDEEEAAASESVD
jgi:hypothetical protein